MYKEKIILQEDPDTIEVSLSPDKTPHAYAQKVKELMESCGLFAVKGEAVDCSDVWSPYTKKILTVK